MKAGRSISIVIPAFNEEKYISECLSHVLQNKSENVVEVIVVDNCSTDRTGEIVKKFNEVVLVEENRSGVMHARAHGASIAKGELIAFLDADTHMPQYWTEKIEHEFNKCPDLVCLSGPVIYHDLSTFKCFLVSVYWNLMALPMYYCVGYMAVFTNMVLKKDIIEKMGGLDTSISFYGDDTNTSRRAAKFGKVKFDRDLIMHASARRLTHQGILFSSYKYGINFLSEVFLHRPAKNEDYKTFR